MTIRTTAITTRKTRELVVPITPRVFGELVAVMEGTAGFYPGDRERMLRMLAFYYGYRLEKLP